MLDKIIRFSIKNKIVIGIMTLLLSFGDLECNQITN
jgi:hypothetical protein